MALSENNNLALLQKRRTYSADFKAMTVLRSIEGDISLTALAQELNLNPNQIKNWRTQMRQKLKTIFRDKRKRNPAETDDSAGVSGSSLSCPAPPPHPQPTRGEGTDGQPANGRATTPAQA